MSVLQAALLGHDDHRGRVAVAECSYTAMSIAAPAGEVLVVRVTGEIDLLTVADLRGALTSSLARGPCHLLVDLAGVTFCSAAALGLLVQAGRAAAGQGTGYGVTGASAQVDRAWTVLWPAGELPNRYPTAAAGVNAAIASM